MKMTSAIMLCMGYSFGFSLMVVLLPLFQRVIAVDVDVLTVWSAYNSVARRGTSA